jgi:hypothetical protein
LRKDFNRCYIWIFLDLEHSLQAFGLGYSHTLPNTNVDFRCRFSPKALFDVQEVQTITSPNVANLQKEIIKQFSIGISATVLRSSRLSERYSLMFFTVIEIGAWLFSYFKPTAVRIYSSTI